MTTGNKLPASKWSSAYQANKQVSPGGLTEQDFLHRARGRLKFLEFSFQSVTVWL